MVLYLGSSALDISAVAWAFYDGTGETSYMSGDQSEVPYNTGLHVLRDGWQLIQVSPFERMSRTRNSRLTTLSKNSSFKTSGE